MKFYGILFLLAGYITRESLAATIPPATTAWPEICRVMSLYRTCSDTTFRIACPNLCSDISAGCQARSMEYIPSKGTCYGITTGGQNVWAFAMSSCSAYGAKLAVLKDASDAEVFEYLNTAGGGSDTKFMVGAVNTNKVGIWTNVDGTEVDEAFWVNSKPSSNNENMCMYSDKQNSFQKDYDNCNQNRAFICAGYD